MKKNQVFWLFVLLAWAGRAEAQIFADTLDALFIAKPPTTFSSKKLLIVGGGGYAATLVGLDRLWYANQPRSSFHFFDDSREWLQVDKVGHFYGAYQLSRVSTGLLLQTDMSKKKALWIGGLTGAILMTPIEVLDGFSSAYGASWTDLVANSAGSALLLAQNLTWGECRVQPRISFRPSKWAKGRPNVLGSNILEQSLKDYNGQTYWLATNVRSFAPKATWFPPWLNVAVGYGAEGLLGGHDNVWLDAQNQTIDYSHVPRYRQYYLALDIDFTKIRTRKRWVCTLLYLAGHLHVPSPTLEFTPHNRKLKFHGVYF